ncbi:MAG TPA: hypothetical protein VEF36_02475 [Roseiarcus sp.]|nr:hypothetical protein [Roseiarcus sp.]
MKRFAVATAALTALSGQALGAEVRIADVKAYLFLERAGKLSEDVVGAPPFVNLPKGGGPDHETATGILVDLTFSGDKNSAPKYATATVDIVQSGRAGQRIVTHKAFTNFIFGADGVEHKAFFLEGATCMPLAIEVRAGKSEKTAKLDFQCKE